MGRREILMGLVAAAVTVGTPALMEAQADHPAPQGKVVQRDVSSQKGYGTHFQTSDRCVACHNGLTTSTGEDISIGVHWRTSMMANCRARSILDGRRPTRNNGSSPRRERYSGRMHHLPYAHDAL